MCRFRRLYRLIPFAGHTRLEPPREGEGCTARASLTHTLVDGPSHAPAIRPLSPRLVTGNFGKRGRSKGSIRRNTFIAASTSQRDHILRPYYLTTIAQIPPSSTHSPRCPPNRQCLSPRPAEKSTTCSRPSRPPTRQDSAVMLSTGAYESSRQSASIRTAGSPQMKRSPSGSSLVESSFGCSAQRTWPTRWATCMAAVWPPSSTT